MMRRLSSDESLQTRSESPLSEKGSGLVVPLCPPRSPKEWVEQSQRGLWGNCLRMWWRRRDLPLPCNSLWVPNRTPGLPPFSLSISPQDLSTVPEDCLSSYYFVELPPPNSGRLFQFRLGVCDGRTELLWTTGSKSLRHYVKNGELLQDMGVRAYSILKSRIPPEDYEMLLDLIDPYKRISVEATLWDRAVGIFERQLCFWEIRGY